MWQIIEIFGFFGKLDKTPISELNPHSFNP
jgi:hypothetical protein